MNIPKILASKGQGPIIEAINASVRDLKAAGYEYSEIRDTIMDTFYGFDDKVNNHIHDLGYF